MTHQCNLHSSVVPRYPCLITWTLWHHLRHPPAHILFQKALKRSVDSSPIRFTIAIAPLVGLLACCGIEMLLISLKLSIPILALAVMVTLSSGYVITWVIRISASITGERERGTYDLLCLSPPGALGANWALCAASLHHDDALGWIDFLRRLLTGLLLLILLIVLLTTAFRENAPDPLQFLGLFLDMLLLAAMAYVEHVQAIVLGSLVGMLVPAFSRTRVDVRVWGAVVFVMIQAIALMMALLAGLVILPAWHTDISSIFISLLVFYLIREGSIIALWRRLIYQLNVNPAEFDAWT